MNKETLDWIKQFIPRMQPAKNFAPLKPKDNSRLAVQAEENVTFFHILGQHGDPEIKGLLIKIFSHPTVTASNHVHFLIEGAEHKLSSIARSYPEVATLRLIAARIGKDPKTTSSIQPALFSITSADTFVTLSDPIFLEKAQACSGFKIDFTPAEYLLYLGLFMLNGTIYRDLSKPTIALNTTKPNLIKHYFETCMAGISEYFGKLCTRLEKGKAAQLQSTLRSHITDLTTAVFAAQKKETFQIRTQTFKDGCAALGWYQHVNTVKTLVTLASATASETAFYTPLAKKLATVDAPQVVITYSGEAHEGNMLQLRSIVKQEQLLKKHANLQDMLALTKGVQALFSTPDANPSASAKEPTATVKKAGR